MLCYTIHEMFSLFLKILSMMPHGIEDVIGNFVIIISRFFERLFHTLPQSIKFFFLLLAQGLKNFFPNMDNLILFARKRAQLERQSQKSPHRP